MVIIICGFNYQILYQSSMHLFLRGKKNSGNLKMLPLPVARESAAMEIDLDLSVIHYLLCCFVFFSRLWSRAGNIFF